MSRTLGDLVDEVQGRVNVGFLDAVVVKAINDLYLQACLKPVRWNLVAASPGLQVTKGAAEVTGSLPSDFDPIQPSYLSGDASAGYAVEIPYRPASQIFRHQAYGAMPAAEKQYSVWTFRSNGTSGYTAALYPFAAGGTHTLPFVYHKRPASLTSSDALPWPDNLDPLMNDLIEAELLRRLRASGWEVAQKKAQDLLNVIVENALSTKEIMQGLAFGQRTAAELQTQGRTR